MMLCEECGLPADTDARIEWLTVDGWAESLYIRLTHPNCCYYDKRRELIEELGANDHWLPLEDIEPLLDIAFEMPWTDRDIAIRSFLRYINNRKQQSSEVLNENN